MTSPSLKCNICQDVGWVDDEWCECKKKEARRYYIKEAGFPHSATLSYKECMKSVDEKYRKKLKSYFENYSKQPGRGLYISGPPSNEKLNLACAIGRMVIKKLLIRVKFLFIYEYFIVERNKFTNHNDYDEQRKLLTSEEWPSCYDLIIWNNFEDFIGGYEKESWALASDIRLRSEKYGKKDIIVSETDSGNMSRMVENTLVNFIKYNYEVIKIGG